MNGWLALGAWRKPSMNRSVWNTNMRKAGFEVSQYLRRRDVRGVLADILVLGQRFSQRSLAR